LFDRAPDAPGFHGEPWWLPRVDKETIGGRREGVIVEGWSTAPTQRRRFFKKAVLMFVVPETTRNQPRSIDTDEMAGAARHGQ